MAMVPAGEERSAFLGGIGGALKGGALGAASARAAKIAREKAALGRIGEGARAEPSNVAMLRMIIGPLLRLNENMKTLVKLAEIRNSLLRKVEKDLPDPTAASKLAEDEAEARLKGKDKKDGGKIAGLGRFMGMDKLWGGMKKGGKFGLATLLWAGLFQGVAEALRYYIGTIRPLGFKKWWETTWNGPDGLKIKITTWISSTINTLWTPIADWLSRQTDKMSASFKEWLPEGGIITKEWFRNKIFDPGDSRPGQLGGRPMRIFGWNIMGKDGFGTSLSIDPAWAAEIGQTMIATVASLVGVAITTLTNYVNENKDQWEKDIKKWLDGWSWSDVLLRFPGLFIGVSLGATIGGKVGRVGGVAGYIAGVLLGAAIGGLVGYFSPEIIKFMTAGTTNALNTVFGSTKKDWAIGGATLGATLAFLGLAAVGAVTLPVAIAVMLAATGIGALAGFKLKQSEEVLPANIQLAMQIAAERAEMGWFEKLWEFIKDSMMWKPFQPGTPLQQTAGRLRKKYERDIHSGITSGREPTIEEKMEATWKSVQDKMSAAYDAMNNLLTSINAQIRVMVDSTLDTISNLWNDLTSWFSNLQEQSIQDNADQVQRHMRSIRDLAVLERMAGDFGGTRDSAGRIPGEALRGDQTDFLKQHKHRQEQKQKKQAEERRKREQLAKDAADIDLGGKLLGGEERLGEESFMKAKLHSSIVAAAAKRQGDVADIKLGERRAPTKEERDAQAAAHIKALQDSKAKRALSALFGEALRGGKTLGFEGSHLGRESFSGVQRSYGTMGGDDSDPNSGSGIATGANRIVQQHGKGAVLLDQFRAYVNKQKKIYEPQSFMLDKFLGAEQQPGSGRFHDLRREFKLSESILGEVVTKPLKQASEAGPSEKSWLGKLWTSITGKSTPHMNVKIVDTSEDPPFVRIAPGRDGAENAMKGMTLMVSGGGITTPITVQLVDASTNVNAPSATTNNSSTNFHTLGNDTGDMIPDIIG